MSTTRRGFTLLELLVSIVLTAVALLIAGSALRAATIARERVAIHRTTLEQDLRLRTMLTDMLRHAPRAEAVNESLMHVRRDASGNTTLVFLSVGVEPPFGTGKAWRVTLAPSSAGLLLTAVPVAGTNAAPTLQTVITDASTLRVRFLDAVRNSALTAAPGSRWREDWPLDQSRPAMISIEYSEPGTRPPLLVSLDPLAFPLSTP